VCDLETSRIRRPWPALGRSATAKRKRQWDYSSRSAWGFLNQVVNGRSI